jgi:hypothetical protein
MEKDKDKDLEKKEAEQTLIRKLSLINQNDLLFLKNKKDKIIVRPFLYKLKHIFF